MRKDRLDNASRRPQGITNDAIGICQNFWRVMQDRWIMYHACYRPRQCIRYHRYQAGLRTENRRDGLEDWREDTWMLRIPFDGSNGFGQVGFNNFRYRAQYARQRPNDIRG